MDLTGYGAPRGPSDLAAWLLNVVPSLAVGFVVYEPLARWMKTKQVAHPPVVGHLRRCGALYVVALVVGVPLVHDISSQDFWSFGQLALWPWLTAVAGILADVLTIRRGNSNRGS